MEFRGCSWLNECSANLFQLSSSAYYDRLPFRKLIQQIFVYDDVAQGHTPFSSLDLELKRMNKRMNSSTEKTGTKHNERLMLHLQCLPLLSRLT